MNKKSVMFKVLFFVFTINNCNCDDSNSNVDIDSMINLPKVVELKEDDIISVQDMDRYEFLCKEWIREKDSSNRADIVRQMDEIGIRVAKRMNQVIRSTPGIECACDRNRDIFNKVILPFYKVELKMALLHPDGLRIRLYGSEDDLKRGVSSKDLSKQEYIRQLYDELESHKKSLFI